MTEKEVREIALSVYMEHNEEIINGLVRLIPQMTTKEVVQYLGVSRQWISKNRDIFNGRVVNRRGDLRFPTAKVVEYKRKHLKEF